MELQIFKNNEFGSLRAIERNGEPWFVGKDVATALGYSNTGKAILMHVDEEDRKIQKYIVNFILDYEITNSIIKDFPNFYNLFFRKYEKRKEGECSVIQRLITCF